MFHYLVKGAALVALCVLAGCSSVGGLSQLAGAPVVKASAAPDVPPTAKNAFVPEAPRTAQVAALDAVPVPQRTGNYNGLEGLINHYAAVYQIPVTLIHRVIDRESDYNPKARNGPYFGLMQISYPTARTMGYTGSPEGLLDADTNLRYATKYLAGAYIVGGKSEDMAIRHYSRGYYYDAKAQGLLEVVGLR